MTSPIRVERLREVLTEPLLVTGASNLTYLTGFKSSNAALLVDQDRVFLFTDSRYADAAAAVPGVEFVETGRVILADLATRLSGSLGFERHHLSYAGYETLGGGGLELVPRQGLVEGLRAIKDANELAAIARASGCADRAFEQLLAEEWIGQTETELLRTLRMAIFENGGEDFAFAAIVGSGPNAARPHALPGDRFVADGDSVVVDFGVLLNGYRSDVARTALCGRPAAELEEIVDVCLSAHLEAIERIEPGMTGVEADAVARSVIVDAGYGDYFGHGLGHGVGLEIHEAPFVSKISTDSIEVGQIVTIEPGIYLPGIGGVRIEDLCVVGDNGLESLTSLPKLVTAGAFDR